MRISGSDARIARAPGGQLSSRQGRIAAYPPRDAAQRRGVSAILQLSERAAETACAETHSRSTSVLHAASSPGGAALLLAEANRPEQRTVSHETADR